MTSFIGSLKKIICKLSFTVTHIGRYFPLNTNNSEVARSVGIVLKRECKLLGKIYYKIHTVLSYLVCYPLYMLYLNLSCEYGLQLFGVHFYSSCVYRGDLRFTFLCVYCFRTCCTIWVLLYLM
jgi:hypothetical protein